MQVKQVAGAVVSCGELLRRYRHRARLTQSTLAERSGYSIDYLSKLERGQRLPPSAAIDRLADVLKLEGLERDELHVARERALAVSVSAARTDVVGRSHELEQIDRLLAGIGPRVLLVTGEPGIGKTRMLEEAATHGKEGGWTVVRGECHRWAQDPYAPLSDALADSIHERSEGDARSMLQDEVWPDLLVPELSSLLGSAPGRVTERGENHLAPAQQRRLLFAGVVRYLQRAAGPAGTLLVLDDLQWANSDALDLLATILHSGDTPRIRLIAAYRDSELEPGSSLADLVAELARTSRGHMLPLGPLSASEAEQLLADLLTEDESAQRVLVPAIARRAGGVPFFLVSYAQDVHLRRTTGPQTLELPWSIIQVIRQRVAALPRDVQDLLGLTSVIGRVASRSMLIQVSGLSEDAVLAALENAVTVRILDEDGDRAYLFTHELIRETIERDLSAGKRQLLHRRIGEALEHDEFPSVESLAYHFARSDDHSKAFHYLEMAGDQALERFAHSAAVAFFREANDQRVRGGRTHDAVALDEKLGTALFAEGKNNEAIEVLDRAFRLYEAAADDEGMRRVAGRAAEAHFRRGTGHEVLDEVAALASSPVAPINAGSRGAIGLREGLFRLLFGQGSYTQLLNAARALARVGRATGNPRIRGLSERTEGVALIFLGRLTEGVTILEAAVPRGLAAGERQRAVETALALNAGYLGMGSLQRCLELSRQMLPIAQSLNDPTLVASHITFLGAVLHVQGDWDQADVYFREADALFLTTGTTSVSLRVAALRAPSLIWEGRMEEARRYLETFLQNARSMHAVASERQALSRLAELDVLQGRPQSAIARLEGLVAGDLAWSYAIVALSILAWAYLESGQLDRAEMLVERATAEARRTEAWLPGVEALRVQGMIDTQKGRHDRAAGVYEEALRRARSICFPYAEAQILYAYALLHRERGEMLPLRGKLVQALALFERLGSRSDIERVRRTMQDN